MSELVSVIIPVYNSAQFLTESLESVINQTYQNIEIICVNDGSTDNSLEILQQYSDKITIISQKNYGLASALNLGIRKMKGIWFKWFSPDDIMYPYTIQTLIDESKNNPNTILYSNWNIIDENGKKLREFQESNYNKLSNFEYNIRLLDRQLINVNTALIPSSLFEKNSMRDLTDHVTIDYDFFLRSALLHDIKFYLISKPLIKYRIHSNQLSHKNILKTMDYISKIKNEILIQLDDSMSIKYINELKKYQKTKSIKQKTLKFGMKILSSMPFWISNRILIFYLNNIRQNR